MRVLELTTDLRFGGAERVVLNLARGLRRQGVECAVAGLFAGGEARGELRERLEVEGFPVYSAGLRRRWRLWRLAGLRRFARDWRADLLHCHLFHGHAAGMLLRRLGLRWPMVWTHHSVDRRPLRARRLFYWRYSGLPACHVYASKAVRDFQRARTAPAAPERVIPNGVELGPYLSVEPGPGRTFGALGRLVEEKGFDVLLAALARLAAEEPEARLRVAGEGPERAALARQIGAEGLEGRAELVGFVRDVPEFLAGVNALVVPSRWESFGLALAEGLAAGLPCVASRVGGLVEVGGDLVRWVEPEDADGLCAAMQQVGPEAWAPEAVARRRERAGRFSAEAMTDAYLALFRQVLGR